MIAHHRLSDEQLVALSAGVGGAEVMAELNASRISLHLMLLKHMADHWTSDPKALDAAVSVLARVQEIAPPVYADLIGDPMVGAWLTRTSRIADPEEAALLQLGGLAAAAALRCGVDAELVGHAGDGRVVLPTIGDAVVGTAVSGPVGISVEPGGRLLIGTSGSEIPVLPLRRLQARHRDLAISVRLEDMSPHRDGYHAPPSGRLSDEEVRRWQHLFTGAWRLLADHLPGWAAEIAQGLRAIVPLADQGDGSSRSGTARESVGAMSMSPPPTAPDLAITLVHEFHHSKLSAVIDMMPLYRSPEAERHRVPWKADPRPTGGVLQGVYAFLGVADTWFHLAAEPRLGDLARRQFTDVRAQVAVGLAALERSTELTPAGVRFVAGMRARFDALSAVSVD